MLPKLQKGYHAFLDNLSGDVYTFDAEKLEWQPFGNTGLHYSRAEASIQGGLQDETVKKTKIHVSNSNATLKQPLIVTSPYDAKCELRKNLMSHWVLKDMYHEFLVENVNQWDPHPVNICYPETVKTSYKTLADGERGPQIAEHQNSIVTQFPIQSKHKETVKLLQNFILQALSKVVIEGKVGIKLNEAFEKIKQSKQIVNQSSINALAA